MRSLLSRWPDPRRPRRGVRLGFWVLLWAVGTAAASIGLAGALASASRQRSLSKAVYYATLQFAPWPTGALLFLGVGTALVGVALYRICRGLPSMREPSNHRDGLSVVGPRRAQITEAPRIVALGGGHGLSTLLRGLKNHATQLTAIVTVADDGGSSGVLRRELGLPPPGDLRSCIVALAQAEPLMTQLFQYRFGRGTGLGGHAFGNLFIAAMTGVTGDFESAVSEASRVLAVRGRILPSSLENVVLCAEIRDPAHPEAEPRLVRGESLIAEAGGLIERVYLQRGEVRGYPQAIGALLDADMIVLGPGSLYTSVLPNLLIPDIRDAVRVSAALKVYICNVATQPGETDNYTAWDHVRALDRHVGEGLYDYVLVNSNVGSRLPAGSGSVMVQPEFDASERGRVILGDLVDKALPWRHDPVKLAAEVMHLYSSVNARVSSPEE